MSHLLTIPRELRDEIYEYTIFGNRRVLNLCSREPAEAAITNDSNNAVLEMEFSHGPLPEIFSLSKQISEEYKEVTHMVMERYPPHLNIYITDTDPLSDPLEAKLESKDYVQIKQSILDSVKEITIISRFGPLWEYGCVYMPLIYWLLKRQYLFISTLLPGKIIKAAQMTFFAHDGTTLVRFGDKVHNARFKQSVVETLSMGGFKVDRAIQLAKEIRYLKSDGTIDYSRPSYQRDATTFDLEWERR